MKQDALGNDIIFGSTYGYARNQNGRNVISIGKATKETKNGITLKIIRRREGIWQEIHDKDIAEIATFINVKSVMLFPVDDNTKKYQIAYDVLEEYFNSDDSAGISWFKNWLEPRTKK